MMICVSNERPNRQENSSMGLNERIRACTPPPEHPLKQTGHMLAHEMGEKGRRSLHDFDMMIHDDMRVVTVRIFLHGFE